MQGENAQGKTNLLEAVATLALARSPRTTTPGDLLRWGSAQCAVEARVRRREVPVTLALRLHLSGHGHVTRTTSVDGKPRAVRDLLGLCPVVLFSPEDLLLVSGGPEARRRQLDILLAQLDPVAAADLVQYRRALAQRNALLRGGHAGARELAGFTAALIQHGSRVRVARAGLVAALAPAMSAAVSAISGGRDGVRVGYLADRGDLGADVDAPRAAAQLRDSLERRAREERARGLTLAGPHRDDVSLSLADRPARDIASQGQQRSIVLALKLAAVQHIRERAGGGPLLLLDDVFGELDRARRDYLLRTVAGMGPLQLLVTATDAAPFPIERFPGSRCFAVSEGTIAAVKMA